MVCESCGFTDYHILDVNQEGWNFVCPSCREGMYVIRRRARTPHSNFQTFTTDEFTGEPVEFTSARHRDEVLEKNHLTLDKVSDIDRRRSRHMAEISASNAVTYDNVMTELKRSRGER